MSVLNDDRAVGRCDDKTARPFKRQNADPLKVRHEDVVDRRRLAT